MENRLYNTCYANPVILLVITIVSVFASELLVMLFLYHGSELNKSLIDAMLLSLLIAPALHVLLYRPLITTLNKSKAAESLLKELNLSLEEKVLQRTEELRSVNKLLEADYIEELRLSEERYKNVIENLAVGVSVIGADLKVISANSQMLKWHPNLEVSKNPTCFEAYALTKVPCKECAVQACLKSGKVSYSTVERVVDGNVRSHRSIASPIIGKDGIIVAVTEVVEDITEEIKNQADLEQAIRERTKELSEAERRYHSLVQNSSEGIFVFDPVTLKIQEANKQLLVLLGYTEAEIVGLELSAFVLAEPDDIAQYVRQMVDEGKAVNVVRQYRRKDASLIDVEIGGSLIQYGKTKVCLVNVRDVSERKRNEQAQRQSVQDLKLTLNSGVQALVQLTEKRDPYTAGHQKRVSKLATAIAVEMGLDPNQIETIHLAGLLHDIGKIYVPTDILNKPGRLTEMEMGIIKTHPGNSHEVLEHIPFKGNVAETVLQHHERLDGSGYPRGLGNGDILLEAKVLGVADVVEAMSSHRPYRPAIGWKLALKEIVDNKGTVYDTAVVEACLRLFIDKNNFLQEGNEEAI